MFILSDQRQTSDAARHSFRRYREYLERSRQVFPSSALALATSEWYFQPDDHRCPHDAWLEEAVFSEPATGDRRERRVTSLRLRLVGAYHDGHVEFLYPRLFRCEWSTPDAGRGHGDWLYDEFRLGDGGRVLHEIEWSSGGRWLMEASDVEFHWIPRPTENADRDRAV
jgi:hypothetical protein